MNKQDLIHKLKELDLTQDERAYLINLVNTKKKYGLVWEDKPEDVEEALRYNLPVLKEVKERAILNGDEHPNHILIEGDNLHALTALTFTHEGTIDVIYIDPPYNTGKKDFKYNDSFVDKEDSYRHSKWLSFMHKRLQIAKRLLTDKGIIYISIDDNEQAQLKLLCDQVFNETNLIAQFIHKNNSNKNQAKLVGVSTEYMLCYAKNKENLKGIEWKTEKKGAKDIVDAFRKLKKQNLTLEEIENEIKELYKRPKYAHLSRWNKVNEKGVFVDADLSREGGAKDYTIINPNNDKPCVIPNRGWGKSLEELERLQEQDLIWYGEDSTPPRMIDYLGDENPTVVDSFLYYDNSVDTKWQKEVFRKLIFENPKPLEMIKLVFSIQNKNNLVILDFFAGSGTTLHATMQLNAEDGGSRQCILVTNNENNICEEVTYERNKNVIQGYKNAKGQQVEGLSQNNLRYYQTTYVPREQTIKTKRSLVRLATELICIKEACYTEYTQAITGKHVSWLSVFTNGQGQYLCTIYDDNYIEEGVALLQQLVAKLQPTAPVKVYVFSNGQYAYMEEFEDILEYITLCALPDAIYKAYQHVLPRKEIQVLPELDEPSAEDVVNELIQNSQIPLF
jgi:adenine-specific DNA-methyltransferase